MIFISFSKPRNKHFPPQYIEGYFFLSTSTLLATLFFFQISRQHYLFQISRRRGGKSRDRGSGGGNFILEKIFTSPGLDPTPILLCRLSVCSAVPELKDTLTNKILINKMNTLYMSHIFENSSDDRPSILLRFRWVSVGTSGQNLANLVRIFLVFIITKHDIVRFFVYAV